MSASGRQAINRAPDAHFAARPLKLQRKCACGASTPSGETCDECKGKLQTKLAVGTVDDPLEHEADRVAERVMASAAPEGIGDAPVRVQRAGGEGASSTQSAPPSVERALAAGGRPLEPSVRHEMERRFGHDFFDVRVHDDAQAQASARDVSAHAYTAGSHIVFGAGSYAPGTSEGRRLLAHELTHVLQQAPASQSAPQRVQRGSLKGPTTKPHTCGGWTCAASSDCKKTDDLKPANTAPSTSWTLTANLDVDVLSANDIQSMGDVGHAFVEFSESNGNRYTYGHYPNKIQLPSDFKPEVPGCTAHPDTTHSACVDMRIPFTLTQAEYTKGLTFAQTWCDAGMNYHLLTQNCTTFVETVVSVAGKKLPSSRGSVAHGAAKADNPNTMFDAYVTQSDSATWRQRVTGKFTGQYDSAGKSIPFLSFELKTDEKYAVGGKYSYTGSSGDKVQGTLDGRLIFAVDPLTKAVTATVRFDWTEPSGSGKGQWTVGTAGDLKGAWGRGAADSGAGAWELTKTP